MADRAPPHDPAPSGAPAGLAPLETLFDSAPGDPIPIGPTLARLYGTLRFPSPRTRPYVVASFASTLDGVVAFPAPGLVGGGEITGRDPHDRMVLGLLRAVADCVVVGAGTVRASPRHRWTPARAFPPLRADFTELRARLEKPPAPLTVVVSARGDLDLTAPLFRGDEAPVLVVTTPAGAAVLSRSAAEHRVAVHAVPGAGALHASAILRALPPGVATGRVLMEGGPRLLGEMLAGGTVDELFLTVAPQVAGRDTGSDRPGIVAGRTLAPERPAWGELRSARRSGSHLFLRYGFRDANAPDGADPPRGPSRDPPSPAPERS